LVRAFSCPAIAFTVRCLSPVIKITSIPIPLRRLMADFEVSYNELSISD